MRSRSGLLKPTGHGRCRMALGGGDFCDDCAWPDCQGVGFCLRAFASPLATLCLPMSQAELLELADELAAPSQRGLYSREDHGFLAINLATVSLTGAGERPVVVPAMPAVPLRSDDGASLSKISTSGSSPALERPAAEAGTAAAPVGGGTPSSSTASPIHAGTQC